MRFVLLVLYGTHLRLLEELQQVPSERGREKEAPSIEASTSTSLQSIVKEPNLTTLCSVGLPVRYHLLQDENRQADSWTHRLSF